MHCGMGPPQGATSKMLSVEEMRENASNMKMQPSLMLPNNIAFQMLFDFCLVDLVPRRAFFPWRPMSSPKVRLLFSVAFYSSWTLYRMNPSDTGSPVRGAQRKPDGCLCKTKTWEWGEPWHSSPSWLLLKRDDEEEEQLSCCHPGVLVPRVWSSSGVGWPQHFHTYLWSQTSPAIWGNILKCTPMKFMIPKQFKVYHLLIASPDFATSSFVVQADLWVILPCSFFIHKY